MSCCSSFVSEGSIAQPRFAPPAPLLDVEVADELALEVAPVALDELAPELDALVVTVVEVEAPPAPPVEAGVVEPQPRRAVAKRKE